MAKGEIGERNEMMLLFSVELGILGLQVQGGPLCTCPLRITPHKVLRPNLRLFVFSSASSPSQCAVWFLVCLLVVRIKDQSLTLRKKIYFLEELSYDKTVR